MAIRKKKQRGLCEIHITEMTWFLSSQQVIHKPHCAVPVSSSSWFKGLEKSFCLYLAWIVKLFSTIRTATWGLRYFNILRGALLYIASIVESHEFFLEENFASKLCTGLLSTKVVSLDLSCWFCWVRQKFGGTSSNFALPHTILRTDGDHSHCFPPCLGEAFLASINEIWQQRAKWTIVRVISSWFSWSKSIKT